MSFKLTTTSTAFMDLINSVSAMSGLVCNSVVDDIQIYSRSGEEHKTHLRFPLQTLWEHCLYAKICKREILLSKVVFFGHVVSKNPIAVDPAKVEAILRWERPTSVTELGSFL